MPLEKPRRTSVYQPSATGHTPEQEADILKFHMPAQPTPKQDALSVNIAALDHRSIQRLGPKAKERQEVKRLLWNAVTAMFERNNISQARLFYEKAEQAYYDYVQIRNRLRYLTGMAIG